MPSPLITATELARRLAGDAAPTVLDVRFDVADGPQPEAYERGHVPGAVFIDLDEDLAGAPGDGGRHPLPGPDRFAAAMRAAGVDSGRSVVVYDAPPA